MQSLSDFLLFIPAIPVCIWVAWSDTKFMRIPNVACYTLFIGFLVLGPLLFGLGEYGLRIAQGFIVLFIGFFMTSWGLVGGGDSKFAAAMAPYIAISHILPFLFIIAAVSLLSIVLHRAIGITPGLKNHVKNWDSWNARGKFPYGVILAASLLAYLWFNVVNS